MLNHEWKEKPARSMCDLRSSRRRLLVQAESTVGALLLLTCLFSVFGTNTVAAEQEGDYYYFVSSGLATITGYKGSGGAITIPSTLGGYPVAVIAYAEFEVCPALTSVTIPDSVTTIGTGAFQSCVALTSVTIGSSVNSIGTSAFGFCSALTSVTIPDSVTIIGESAFYQCTALASVSIGNGVTTIGRGAFFQCTALTSVSIPDSVTTIGEDAFYYCTVLGSVTIGSSVITIGAWAFLGCSALTSVTIGSGVITVGAYAFACCSALTSVTIPDSVTTIGDDAFQGCTVLTSITFYGLTAPTSVGLDWILGTYSNLRGHAYAVSDFPAPGEYFYGLQMGEYIGTGTPPVLIEELSETLPWYVSGLTVDDFDGDGTKEIAAAGHTDPTAGPCHIGMWSSDGIQLTTEIAHEWSTSSVAGSCTAVNYIRAFDTDSDGIQEALTGGVLNNGTADWSEPRAWSWNGVTLQSTVIHMLYQPDNRDLHMRSAAYSDVDDDGFIELLEGGDYDEVISGDPWPYMIISEKDGSSQNRLCEAQTLLGGQSYGALTSVVVDDVDADQVLEIVYGGFTTHGQKAFFGVMWFDGTDSYQDYGLHQECGEAWTSSGTTKVNSVLVSDVDSDGVKEIVTGGVTNDGTRDKAQLRIWTWDGSVLTMESSEEWYLGGSTEILSVCAADTDGDGATEIVTGGYFNDGVRDNAHIAIRSWDGSVSTSEQDRSWAMGSSRVESVFVSDVDADGRNEIVTGGTINGDSGERGDVRIWSLGTPSGEAPVLYPVGDKVVDEETLLTFTATATDPDIPGDTLTFSLSGSIPSGASITTDGVFTWTPSEGQGPGDYTFDVVVTDNYALTDSETITVTVNEVNRMPALDHIGDKSVDEGTLLTFTATASDPDLPAQTLTFKLSSPPDPVPPPGASITADGVFTWTPTEEQGPGSYTFGIEVRDGMYAARELITVTVNEVSTQNNPPIAGFTWTTPTPRYAEFNAQDSYDLDGTIVLPLHWDFGDGVSGSGGFISQHSYSVGGTYTVTLTVTDNEGATGTCSHDITVTDPPSSATQTVTVVLDSGDLYFPGETAEFYVLVSLNGVPADAFELAMVLYSPDGQSTLLGESVATGLYVADYTIPLDATPGTYALVVTADVQSNEESSSGDALACFLLSPTLTEMNSKLLSIEQDVATIETTVGVIQVDLSDVHADLVDVHGDVALIQTDVGLVKSSISAIGLTLVSIDGRLVTLDSAVDQISLDVSAIGGEVTTVKGGVATITSSLGTLSTSVASINARIVSIDDGIATVLTSINALQTSLDSIGAKLASIDGKLATVETTIGTIETGVDDINTRLVSISDSIALVSSSVGDIHTDLASLHAKVSAVDDRVATISTDLGVIKTDVSNINAKVVNIEGTIATISSALNTIQTDVASIHATLVSIDQRTATIQTDLGTVKVDVAWIRAAMNQLWGNKIKITTTVGEIVVDASSIDMDYIPWADGAKNGTDPAMYVGMAILAMSLFAAGALTRGAIRPRSRAMRRRIH